MTLRHVDPTRRRSRLYRWWTRLATTRPALAVSRRIAWKLDPILLRVTGGRLSFALAIPAAVLETRGARTGLVRRHAVIYFHDRDRVVIVASHAGAPEHPAWFHNAVAHPEVRLGNEPFVAQVVTDPAEVDRLWPLADNVFPPYATYRQQAARAGRTIPLLALAPR